MTTTPTPLRDHVLLVDGPLEGRVFYFDDKPREHLSFEVALSVDGEVLGCDGDPAPVNVPHQQVSLDYKRVDADDGCWSRDDHGFLHMTLASE